jgi:hypothetical protein
MVLSRQQPSGELLVELFRSHADLVVMDREAAGSGGCSTTFHGRLGAGVTISIDAVPGVFRSGLLRQHPIWHWHGGARQLELDHHRRCLRSKER